MPEEIKIEVSGDGKSMVMSGDADLYSDVRCNIDLGGNLFILQDTDTIAIDANQLRVMLPYITRWANGAPDFREPKERKPRPWTREEVWAELKPGGRKIDRPTYKTRTMVAVCQSHTCDYLVGYVVDSGTAVMYMTSEQLMDWYLADTGEPCHGWEEPQ